MISERERSGSRARFKARETKYDVFENSLTALSTHATNTLRPNWQEYLHIEGERERCYSSSFLLLFLPSREQAT